MGLRVPVWILVALPLFGACTSRPVFESPGQSGRPLSVAPGARLVLFTLLLRGINASKSQGIQWYAQLDDRDYHRLSNTVRSLLAERWQVEVGRAQAVLDSGVYRSGLFPTQARFFLNPDLLPIVREQQHVDLMLRSAAEHKAGLFAVVLLDFQITKLITRPASVTTSAHLQLYSPHAGFLGSILAEDTRPALPYDRTLDLAQLSTGYRPVMASAIRASFAGTLQKLGDQMGLARSPETPATRPAPATPGR